MICLSYSNFKLFRYNIILYDIILNNIFYIIKIMYIILLYYLLLMSYHIIKYHIYKYDDCKHDFISLYCELNCILYCHSVIVISLKYKMLIHVLVFYTILQV